MILIINYGYPGWKKIGNIENENINEERFEENGTIYNKKNDWEKTSKK